MFLEVIKYAVFFSAFALFLYSFVRKRKTKPALPISSSIPFKAASPLFFREGYITFFFFIALFFMVMGLANPKVGFGTQGEDIVKSDIPREGDAFFLLIDVSSSMEDTVSVEEKNGYSATVKKIDLTKRAASEFIEGSHEQASHAKDLIGLVAFARVASVVSPLTLDHKELLNKLKEITPVSSENLDGTSIGYAIFKIVNLFVATKYYAEKEQEERPLFSVHNAAIIVLTDGLQSPHPQDRDHPFRSIRIESALQYAKQNGIRVYVIEVDPVMDRAQFRSENNRLRKYVEETGGALFIAQNDFPVTQILENIDELKKSASYTETQVHQRPVYESAAPWFIALAGIFFCVAILLETVVIRRAP